MADDASRNGSEMEPLTVDQRLSICKFLSETHRTRMRDRNGEIWKVIFTVLSFYVLAVAALLRGEFKDRPLGVLIAAAFLTPGVAAIGFVFRGLRGNEKNTAIAEQAEASLQDPMHLAYLKCGVTGRMFEKQCPIVGKGKKRRSVLRRILNYFFNRSRITIHSLCPMATENNACSLRPRRRKTLFDWYFFFEAAVIVAFAVTATLIYNYYG